jgi:vanillate O-demethylase ferredoxin subunit
MDDDKNLLPTRVARVWDAAAGIRAYELVDVDVEGRSLPAFEPGAHVDVHTPSGLVRQYSLCGDPADLRTYVIAVKLEPQSRGGSQSMHADVGVDTVLSISRPRHQFKLAAQAASHVLVAGGIGITPILAMARRLATTGAPFDLHYFARSAEHAAFSNLLSQEQFRGRCHFHLGVEPGELCGYLADLIHAHAIERHLYVCGPGPFMQCVMDAAQAKQWPESSLHVEHFKAPDVAADGGEQAFEVRLARSGISCRVEANESILTALERNGIELPSACREGLCGTCRVDVLDGVPDHRDLVLSQSEREAGNCMLPCVSRSRSALLVLDA